MGAGALAAAMFLLGPPGSGPGSEGLPAAQAGVATSAAVPTTPASLPPLVVPTFAPGSDVPLSTAPTQDDIVVRGKDKTAPGDPLQQINQQTFAVTQAVDKAVIAPVVHVYGHTVPAPLREGFHNFTNNLHEPVVFVNFLLQLKPGKAIKTFGRFAINTTIGVGGVLDMARKRPFHLPRMRNGFADTLGFYGIGAGPYFFIPLVGPTTVRDILGGAIDRLVLPQFLGAPFNKPYYAIPSATVRSLNRRLEFDSALEKIRASADPYAARRELYLSTRQAEIDGLRRRHKVDAAAPLGTAPTVKPH